MKPFRRESYEAAGKLLGSNPYWLTGRRLFGFLRRRLNFGQAGQAMQRNIIGNN
jgi:hypothetical protein